MKKGTRDSTFYLLMIVVFVVLMYLLIKAGEGIRSDAAVNVASSSWNTSEAFTDFGGMMFAHVRSTVGILLLQIIVILLACRLFGWVFRKLGQPTVVGEIIAGIVLGPSFLGSAFPSTSAFLFPTDSLNNITIISEFGLILFMFAIGMELDITEVRRKLKETIVISHTSMFVTFLFGMVAALIAYKIYAAEGTPFISFALFIGIAMSITALPVLARIIQEKRFTHTHLGTLSLACAASEDVTAWCLLAVVISIAQAGSILSALINIAFSLLYMVFMYSAVRPFLRMVGDVYHNKEVINKALVAFIFLLLVASCYVTELLGLHALFGAFFAGVVMPSNLKFRKIMIDKVEDVSVALFLPLFFASTGLRTQIGLLDTPDAWSMCLLFIILAVMGMMGGTTGAARFTGESWKDSLCLGAFMNTRGLMELVVLTIGYEMKILPPTIFAIMVIMTIVTTLMTTPLVSLIHWLYRKHEDNEMILRQAHAEGIYKVLLSFGRAGNGQIMLDVAHQLFSRKDDKLRITALHLTVGTDVNPLHTDKFEEVSFGPVLYGAKKLGLHIDTRYEVCDNASTYICDIVNQENYDFLLVGSGITLSDAQSDINATSYNEHHSGFFNRFHATHPWFYPASLLKDKTREFIMQSHCPVGVFVNRDFVRATHILMIIASTDDLFLLGYALTMQRCTHGQISLLDIRTDRNIPDPRLTAFPNEYNTILAEHSLTPETFTLNEYDFLFISYATWNVVSEQAKEALQSMPSTLILSNGKRGNLEK
jgi:Kef-type K+ transport system membrane component KefB